MKKTALWMILVAMLISGVSIASAASIKLGIDNVGDNMQLFAGARVGLITNPTGVDSHLNSTIDVLLAKGVKLTALFGPEHGVRGDYADGAKIDAYKDTRTNLPVYSLYGATFKPTPEMLANVDVLCFDIQDVGARFYTFISTMYFAMQACKEQNKTFVVLDRPNPCGDIVEGAVCTDKTLRGFTAIGPIPTRHGMTIGELAQFMNAEWGIGCKLQVIVMSGYTRAMQWEDTGLQWINPSPNIPTPDTALVYSGTGFFEATNMSEGRGMTKPFLTCGAPWLNATEYARQLNDLELPGVVFLPAYFTPNMSKFQGQMCAGVEIHVLDRRAYLAVRTGLAMLLTAQEMSGAQFAFSKPSREGGTWGIDVMTGDSMVRDGARYEDIVAQWDNECTKFKAASRKYYLYQ